MTAPRLDSSPFQGPSLVPRPSPDPKLKKKKKKDKTAQDIKQQQEDGETQAS